MKYAEDQDAFFDDYAKAHLKLSELGALLLFELWAFVALSKVVVLQLSIEHNKAIYFPQNCSLVCQSALSKAFAREQVLL